MDQLFCGDNLALLRAHVADATVDLVYLDPPFDIDAGAAGSSGRDGAEANAGPINGWRWGSEAAAALDEACASGNPILKLLLQALRQTIGPTALLAYVAMMAIRLVECRRVLRPTGSLYLHGDATVAHYLKIVLDAVFGPASFRREIAWKPGWVSGFKTRSPNWIRNHDTILYYLRDPKSDWTFNKHYIPHEAGYARRGGGGNPHGKPIDDVWDDPALYSPSGLSYSAEKTGYPAQKPVALLARIIAASSRPGDTVLDPFCGSGTTLMAAQTLGRAWIGIDLNPAAIELTRERLAGALKAKGAPATEKAD